MKKEDVTPYQKWIMGKDSRISYPKYDPKRKAVYARDWINGVNERLILFCYSWPSRADRRYTASLDIGPDVRVDWTPEERAEYMHFRDERDAIYADCKNGDDCDELILTMLGTDDRGGYYIYGLADYDISPFRNMPEWLREHWGFRGDLAIYPCNPEDVVYPKRWRKTSFYRFVEWVGYHFGSPQVISLTGSLFNRVLDRLAGLRAHGDYTCEIVYGQKLLDYYNQWPWGGGKSCMVDKPYTRLYAANPDKVGLFVIKKGGQYAGRALLWTDDNGTVLLDRIYPSNSGSHIQYAKGVAKDKGWIYKDVQTYGNALSQEGVFLKVTLSLRNPPYCFPQDGMPYMDTLSVVDLAHLPDRAILYNRQPGERGIYVSGYSQKGGAIAEARPLSCCFCERANRELLPSFYGAVCKECAEIEKYTQDPISGLWAKWGDL